MYNTKYILTSTYLICFICIYIMTKINYMRNGVSILSWYVLYNVHTDMYIQREYILTST